MIKFLFLVFINIACFTQDITVVNSELNESVIKKFIPFKGKSIYIKCKNSTVDYLTNLNIDIIIKLENCVIDNKWKKFLKINKENIIKLYLYENKFEDLSFIKEFASLSSLYISNNTPRKISLNLTDKDLPKLGDIDIDEIIDDNFVDFVRNSKSLKMVVLHYADVAFIKKVELLKLKKKYTNSIVYMEYFTFTNHYFADIQALLRSYEIRFSEEKELEKRSRLKVGRKKIALALKEDDVMRWEYSKNICNYFEFFEADNKKYYYYSLFDYKTSIEYILKYLDFMDFKIPFEIAIFSENNKFENFITIKEFKDLKDMPISSYR